MEKVKTLFIYLLTLLLSIQNNSIVLLLEVFHGVLLQEKMWMSDFTTLTTTFCNIKALNNSLNN